MSTVNIKSASEFNTLLSTSTIVVADFYADWCGPCKAIGPLYEKLSAQYSKKNAVTFTKINVDNQQEIAQKYGVTAMPTFLVFRTGSVIQTLRGADPRALTSAIETAVKVSGAASKPLYSTPGRTLGSSSSPSSPSSHASFSPQAFFDSVIAFFGLYLISLFSIDPYRSAEASVFNIHKRPDVGVSTAGAKAGVRPANAQQGRRFGTLADVSG